MKDADNNPPRLFRRCTGHLCTVAGDVPWAFLLTMGLIVMALLSIPACALTQTPTAVPLLTPYARVLTPTPTSPPTAAPTPTCTPTATPAPPSPTSPPSPTPTLPPEPTATPTCTASPPPPSSPAPPRSAWNPATPVPEAPAGYNPHEACVVNPCAPAPVLIAPENDTEFVVNSSIELSWEWAYCLPPGWKFAIRVSGTNPPHSYRYEDNPVLVVCEGGRTVGHYRLPENKGFRENPGTYYWNIAVARSVEGGWERLSEESEVRMFKVVPGQNGDDSCPVPPCK